MKKFLYFSAAALTTLFAASCSSEDPAAPAPAGEGATFTINLPADLQTRANQFGNGKSAPNLHYAVYAVEGNKAGQALPVFEGNAIEKTTEFEPGQLQTKVTLDLPHGVKYNIVFFACNDASKAYTFNAANGNFSVNYENMTAYSEDNDCFIYTVKDFSIQGPTSSTVTLYRPVAQLNIGTSDYAQAVNGALDPSKTKVTVNRVYNTFNFLAGGEMTDKTGVKGIMGQAEGDAVKAVFGPEALAIPEDEDFPYEPATYKYMSMNYVLVGNEKDVVDVNFALGDERYNEVTFNNVPMQRNYRTNIFGALLTSPADFDVIIEPDFYTPDYNYTQEVAGAEELANALAEGKTAKLTSDITVDELPAMKDNKGVINLNNHTLTVNNYVHVDGDLTVENGTFKTGKNIAFNMLEGGNLTLANVKGDAKSSFVLIEPKSNQMKGSVNISDCELTGTDYCVSTNATILSSANILNFKDYSLNINNTKMSGCETPVMVNIPIKVQVNDCELIGKWQGMLLRGCSATLNNNVITTTWAEDQENESSQGSGNNVPRAALTVLNGAPYSSNAIVYAYDNTFNGTETAPSVYALKQVSNKLVTVSGNRNILTGKSPVAVGGAIVNFN